MNKYKKIVDDLIKKSFPRLRGKNIQIYEIPKFFIWWAGGFVFGRFIIISSGIHGLTRQSKIGLLAHELCHVEDSQERSFFQECFNFIRENLSWAFNTPFSENIERKTDLKVIKKGYAQELFEFAIKREKYFSKKKLEKLKGRGYLDSVEIKTYAKKIGKW